MQKTGEFDCKVKHQMILHSQLFLLSTDIIDRGELKTFFESNCSQIYFIFYENFTTLESSLKQKGESAG